MVEYNFWDDRTTEENDDYWCPIGCCYCLDDRYCYECKDYKDFMSFYTLYDDTLNTCDIANYIKNTCCCFYGWLCPSHNHEVCSNMAIISINMILDHLY